MQDDTDLWAQMVRPFGIPSFLRAPVVSNVAEEQSIAPGIIAVLGVPTDVGSPFYPGSRMGPRGIREHSLRFGNGYYDHRTGRVLLEREMSEGLVIDVGDVDIRTTNVEDTFRNITDSVRSLVGQGALPVILGGDHAITFPVVRAYTRPLHMVHFDAHVDYAPFSHGFDFTNAHVCRHIHAMKHVRTLTQVGIRSIRNPASWVEDTIADGNVVVTIFDFRQTPIGQLFEHLPENEDCYVSIDIDVLDMPLVPGCVSAEPGGMSYEELRDSLEALAKRMNIVGIDLVEVNPLLDISTGATSYLAAHTIVEFLGHVCDQDRWKNLRLHPSRMTAQPDGGAGAVRAVGSQP